VSLISCLPTAINALLMKTSWPQFLFLSLAILWSCGSDENLLNPNNPNPQGTSLTDETRLEVLEKCDLKIKELNNIKTLADKVQFIVWAMQQPEFRTAGFLDGNGVYAMFTDERVALFVDTPLTDDPSNGGRMARGENAEKPGGGMAHQTSRTGELPKSNQVTLFNGMGRYFEDNTLAIEKIFQSSPSTFSVKRKDATIENFKVVGGDGVFYLFTHGGAGGIPNPPPRIDSTFVMGLWTKNEVDVANEIAYKQLLDEKKLAYMKASFDTEDGVWHYAITQEFVKAYMSFADNGVIYIDACNSFRDTEGSRNFRNTVLDKVTNKKGTYFGWTNVTNLFNASQASQFIFDRLLGTNTSGYPAIATIPKEDPYQRPFDLEQIYIDLRDRGFGICANGATLRYQSNADANDEILLTPTIEKLEIYESLTADKSILQIYGSFGSEKGKVTVNEIEMDNVEWAPSVITCTIPDGGQGHAGEVIVEVHGLKSNPVPLTYWNIKLTYSTNDNGVKLEGVIDLKLRADVHPRRTKPKETPTLPEYADLAPSSGYSFEKSSQATYSISGEKFAKCNWVPCPNTFQESPHVKNGVAPYMKLTAPANAPKLLALYNWAPDRKSIKLTILHVNLPDITTTSYYHLADCPGEDQELRSTELTSFNFALPDYELNDVLELHIAENYNIRAGSYLKTLSRPWDPCDGSGTFQINVTWELSHPQFEPTNLTPARLGNGD
jgi:hypothetical protein